MSPLSLSGTIYFSVLFAFLTTVFLPSATMQSKAQPPVTWESFIMMVHSLST